MNATTEKWHRPTETTELWDVVKSASFYTCFRWTLVLSITLVAGFQLLHLVTWTPYELAIHGIFLDDAYFYSVLARNFHEFGFLTLDGEVPTNGVQPLWMGLQIVLTRLWPKVDEVFLLSWSSWACYVLFAALSTWFVTHRSPSLYAMSLAGVIVAGLITLNVKFQQLVVKGLETPLMLVILLLTLMMIDHAAKVMPTRRAGTIPILSVTGLALTSSLCFFARTDLFWVALVTGSWLLTMPGRWRSLLIYASTVSILVFPYLASNYLSHASIVPISGRVKLHYLNTFYPYWNDYLSSEEWQGFFLQSGITSCPTENRLLPPSPWPWGFLS